MFPAPILTNRLKLVPCPLAVYEAVLFDRPALDAAVGARVPKEWPGADLMDAIPHFREGLAADPTMIGWTLWLAISPSEGALVGDVGFHGRPDPGGVVELGYSLIPSARGRGLATEATVAMVHWLSSQPGVERIVAKVEPDNAASIAVLGRAGFERAAEADGERLVYERLIVSREARG